MDSIVNPILEKRLPLINYIHNIYIPFLEIVSDIGKKNTKEMNKLNYNDDLLKGNDQYWWDKSWSEFVFLTYAQILPANFSNAMAASHAEYGQIHGLEWPWYFSW